MLSNIQERIERSVIEKIRLILVREGYWPDITDTVAYPPNQPQLFDDAVDAIVVSKGFAIEPFGHSSSRAKYEKKCPRIVFVSRRILPGSIGNPSNPIPVQDPTDPDRFFNVVRPQESSNMHFDLYLTSATGVQDRVLNAVIYSALGGQKLFIEMYDNVNEYFFVRQYNYYDLPDSQNGIEEKVYSYQVDDIYLTSSDDEVVGEQVVPIIDIEADLDLQKLDGENDDTEKFHIDQQGIDIGNKRY